MSQQIHNLIAAATRNFELTESAVQIGEWDRVSQVNGVAAPAVIAALQDPDGRPIPNTRAVELRVLALDVVVLLQRCHPVTNEPLHSDADVVWVAAWVRTEVLPGLIADPRKFKAVLDGALVKRVLEDARADPGGA
jgi:hypothetical protein